MAIFPFLGSGDPIEAFNINHVLTNKPLIYAEVRLRTAFPYPTLENWRRQVLQRTAVEVTTGLTVIGTQARTVTLFAHEADLGTIFYSLVGTPPAALEGYYVDKQKIVTADAALAVPLKEKDRALIELRQQGVPAQHCDLIRTRLESTSCNHRVPGMCAAVYLTAIILYQAELDP